jgi:hypothetical protein
VLPGCGSDGASAGPVEKQLLEAVAAIGATHDDRALRGKLGRTFAKLEHDRATTAAGRRARSLTAEGLRSSLGALQSNIAFAENDSGNIEAATRDAVRADRLWRRAAKLLRSAGRVLGLRVGRLRGY